MTNVQPPLPLPSSYRVTTEHVCGRCGMPARVVATGHPVDLGQTPGWDLQPFDGGVVALPASHRSTGGNQWFWGVELDYCGFRTLSGDSLPENVINSLYRDLHRWEEPTEQIESFDLDAFLAAPYVTWATAAGAAPLLLVANPMMFRHILVSGTVPATNRGINLNHAPAELKAARDAFLAGIGASVRPLA